MKKNASVFMPQRKSDVCKARVREREGGKCTKQFQHLQIIIMYCYFSSPKIYHLQTRLKKEGKYGG